jgi:hypothetical protein
MDKTIVSCALRTSLKSLRPREPADSELDCVGVTKAARVSARISGFGEGVEGAPSFVKIGHLLVKHTEVWFTFSESSGDRTGG